MNGGTPPTLSTLCSLVMCSDTAWSIPRCAVVSASISVEGPLSAVVAPLWELEDDGTEGRSEESGAASTKEDHIVSNLP